MPDDEATNLQTCGNTAFRETQVTIDGQPAGIAPVYPWIYTGTISVASNRKFVIRGYVDTSHGRVETTVEQSVGFLNNQQFNVGPTTDIQNVQQTTTVDSRTSTRDAFFVNTTEQHFKYPLTIDFSYVVKPDGSASQVTTVDQKDLFRESKNINGFRYYENKASEAVNTTDTLSFSSSGAFLGPSGSQSIGTYSAKDSLGHCYSRTITAAAQKLTAVTDGQGCRRDRDDHDDH